MVGTIDSVGILYDLATQAWMTKASTTASSRGSTTSRRTQREARVEGVVGTLTNLSDNKAHDRHFHLEDCQRIGLEVEVLEDDDEL